MPEPIVNEPNVDMNVMELEGEYFDDPDGPEDWMNDLREESFIVSTETLREPWIFNS
jgi:hypothetical protein